MRIRQLHSWDVTPAEAVRIQGELRGELRLEDRTAPDRIRVVVGLDNGYVRSGDQTMAYAAAIAVSFPDLIVLETRLAARPVTFPYVPGLLSFREAPAVIAALEELSADPDLLVFDAHGYAHPRRLGLASHLGLLADRPSIGCAKSRLVGRYDEPERTFGARAPLVDRGEVVGVVVRTRPTAAPIFVSAGHALSLDTAVELTLACCRGRTRLPLPTHLAHETVTAHGRELRAALS